MGFGKTQNNSFSPEALAEALSILVQDQEIEQEAELEAEQESEQESEVKGQFHVYNGNSYVKNSGNSYNRNDVTVVTVIVLVLVSIYLD
ncbi:hypothetical protein J416_11667 [Gracilibacillus halophilus YIM-C55.5]|uniref:Uncharacterized protein n=1 Tax=Gracilibacillus halophilus YIM-C55.5 TaxID=1308866 RepID=N4WAG8_9BACI|nr:hypothetical protein [Gracilibacillus halophilus]ENH96274.1 hypothetical protein J416_11667 [Gracilibacillus halophilus YIM-C55.5]